jgi:hypothetical protein
MGKPWSVFLAEPASIRERADFTPYRARTYTKPTIAAFQSGSSLNGFVKNSTAPAFIAGPLWARRHRILS